VHAARPFETDARTECPLASSQVNRTAFAFLSSPRPSVTTTRGPPASPPRPEPPGKATLRAITATDSHRGGRWAEADGALNRRPEP
jgi:hypothetical protein